MKLLRNHLFEWQYYWKWHFSYAKREDEDFGIYDHYLCIGPFQFHWVSSAIPKDM